MELNCLRLEYAMILVVELISEYGVELCEFEYVTSIVEYQGYSVSNTRLRLFDKFFDAKLSQVKSSQCK